MGNPQALGSQSLVPHGSDDSPRSDQKRRDTKETIAVDAVLFE